MAVGDRSESRLGGPTQLGTSTTTICTAATGYAEVIKQIIICNTDTVDRTVTLAVGSAATASNRIMSALPIGANDVIVRYQTNPATTHQQPTPTPYPTQSHHSHQSATPT